HHAGTLELVCLFRRPRGAGDLVPGLQKKRHEASADGAGGAREEYSHCRMLPTPPFPVEATRCQRAASFAKISSPAACTLSPPISSGQRCCSKTLVASSSKSRPITTPIPQRIPSAARPSATR